LRPAEVADPKDGVKDCNMDDAWFRPAWACAALGVKGHKAFLHIKGNKGIYPKDFISEKMMKIPGGTAIVLKGTHQNGTLIIAIGYRYSIRMTLFFMMTEDAGVCGFVGVLLLCHCCVVAVVYCFS
jgi:hypothetical protein